MYRATCAGLAATLWVAVQLWTAPCAWAQDVDGGGDTPGEVDRDRVADGDTRGEGDGDTRGEGDGDTEPNGDERDKVADGDTRGEGDGDTAPDGEDRDRVADGDTPGGAEGGEDAEDGAPSDRSDLQEAAKDDFDVDAEFDADDAPTGSGTGAPASGDAGGSTSDEPKFKGVGERIPRARLQTENSPLEPGADRNTGVEGRVVSRKPKKVLPQAPVVAKGQDGKVRNTLTNKRGRYKLFLPPGKYTLVSLYDLYNGAQWDDITVTRGKFRKINFILDPLTDKQVGVEEVEIAYLADTSSEAAQLNIRKEAVAVQDAISAEEISRSGDSTAGGAAKRVPGVLVDENGRIIVRGLGPRYNRILVNKVVVPSVDPDNPSVRLDIFPSEIISNLAVVKSGRPDLPGVFGGGLVLIETASFPRELKFKAGLSLGGDSMSTFRRRADYPGGKFDWLGFDSGRRSLPSTVGGNQVGGTLQERAETARSFPNIWEPTRRFTGPNIGLKFSVGNTITKKKEREIAYQLVFTYSVSNVIRDGFNRRFRFDDQGQANLELADFNFEQGSLKVLWGLFGSGTVKLDANNRLSIVAIYSRSLTDKTRLQLGFSEATPGEEQSDNAFDFQARGLLFTQLFGDHQNLTRRGLRVRWDLMGSHGTQDQPDRRQIQQITDSQRLIRANRFYGKLRQFAFGGGAEARIRLWDQGYLTLGGRGEHLRRDFSIRRFDFEGQGAAVFGDPEDIFAPENFGATTTIREVTAVNTDGYDAKTLLLAAFAKLETPLGNRWRLSTGLRVSSFGQDVTPVSPIEGQDSTADAVNRNDIDYLPSLSLKYQLRDNMSLRWGYSATVIRPQIRQLAPFTFLDFERGWNIEGNPDLERTRIQSGEMRWEWYFRTSNLLAVTGFGKYMLDTIEFAIQSVQNRQATYLNADNAWAAGSEIELRLDLGTLTEKLKRFYFTGNATLMTSRVQRTLENGDKVRRRLFDQANFVSNLSLRFDDPDSGWSAGLIYNFVSPRTIEVGGSAGNFLNPDVFFESQHLLDLVAAWKATEHLKLGFKWKNIALQDRRYRQGDRLVFRENRGTTVSLSATVSY